MLKRLDNQLTEENFKQGKTLVSVSDIPIVATGTAGFLPNMSKILTFKAFDKAPINFYVSNEEFLKLLTTDFYEITKDMALKAQKNTVSAAMEDKRTSMSDYLFWVNATALLDDAITDEKKAVETFLGK